MSASGPSGPLVLMFLELGIFPLKLGKKNWEHDPILVIKIVKKTLITHKLCNLEL